MLKRLREYFWNCKIGSFWIDRGLKKKKSLIIATSWIIFGVLVTAMCNVGDPGSWVRRCVEWSLSHRYGEWMPASKPASQHFRTLTHFPFRNKQAPESLGILYSRLLAFAFACLSHPQTPVRTHTYTNQFILYSTSP